MKWPDLHGNVWQIELHGAPHDARKGKDGKYLLLGPDQTAPADANGYRRGGMSDIRQWLEELGLAQYADRFEESAVNLEVLPKLRCWSVGGHVERWRGK